MSPPPVQPRTQLRVGKLWIDSLTFAQALEDIEHLVERGRGGAVFTPNVDHIVTVEADPAFEAAYGAASLSLVDGQPLLWASHLLGEALPEKISGSDLVLPLMERAGARGWRVYLLGGGPGVAEKAAGVLKERFGVKVVGTDAPMLRSDDAKAREAAVGKIVAARPQVLLVALGAPKQELFIHRSAAALGPVVSVAIGAGLDFVAGTLRRAPRWMSEHGLEWLYRLAQEPRRLWRRYLVNDPKMLLILLRSLRRSRAERVRTRMHAG
ncbi:MAG: WecB/TagA/CpsF family glycosyltransferase [Myxococcaceae bacterium]